MQQLRSDIHFLRIDHEGSQCFCSLSLCVCLFPSSSWLVIVFYDARLVSIFTAFQMQWFDELRTVRSACYDFASTCFGHINLFIKSLLSRHNSNSFFFAFIKHFDLQNNNNNMRRRKINIRQICYDYPIKVNSIDSSSFSRCFQFYFYTPWAINRSKSELQINLVIFYRKSEKCLNSILE